MTEAESAESSATPATNGENFPWLLAASAAVGGLVVVALLRLGRRRGRSEITDAELAELVDSETTQERKTPVAR